MRIRSWWVLKYQGTSLLTVSYVKILSLNKCLNNIDIKTQIENDYEKRMKESVIYIQLKDNVNIQKIAEIFNIYGDINVNKSIQFTFDL